MKKSRLEEIENIVDGWDDEKRKRVFNNVFKHAKSSFISLGDDPRISAKYDDELLLIEGFQLEMEEDKTP